MKLNIPELAHYIVGGAILIASWVPIMSAFPNVYAASAVWILEYIIVDQILHVVIKHEKINIVK